MARQCAFLSSATPAKVSRMSFLSEWKSPRRAPGPDEGVDWTFSRDVWRAGLARIGLQYLLITCRRLCGYILIQHQSRAAA